MAEKTSGTIVTPDGALASAQVVVLDHEDAALLRAYQRFLRKQGLREALFCNDCWDTYNLSDGCEAHVTQNDILIRCRCRMRFYRGMTV